MHAVRTGDKNPIAARGIKEIQTPLSSWCTEKTRASDWANYINPKKTPAPQKADEVLKSRKVYGSGSAQKKRDSLAAFQALRLVMQMDCPPIAAKQTWKCSLFAPQALLIKAQSDQEVQEAYLLLAVAADCCRVCKVLQVPSMVPSRFLLDLSSEWEWLTIVNLQIWEVQPYQWAINESHPEKHGFFCMISIVQSLPADAAVLCRAKSPVPTASRSAVAKDAMPSGTAGAQDGKHAEEQLINTRLENLPEEDAKWWKTAWYQTQAALDQREKKVKQKALQKKAAEEANVEWSSDDGSDISFQENDCPDEVDDLFFAAVDEIDAKDFPQDDARRLKGAVATARREKVKVARALKQNKSQTEKKALKQATKAGTETGPVVLDAAAKAKFESGSRYPWVRKFVPDAPDVIGALFNHVLHKTDGTTSWTARFAQTWAPTGKKGLQHDAEVKKTHTRLVGGARGLTEHQCFQECLEWLWLKQQLLDPDCSVPEFVQRELAVCSKCSAKQPCDRLATLAAATDADSQLPVVKSSLKRSAEHICSAHGKALKTKTSKAPPADPAAAEACSFCGGFHKLCPFLSHRQLSEEIIQTLIAAMSAMYFNQGYKKAEALRPSSTSKGFDEWFVPTDGNCLFAALAMGFQ